VGTPYQLLRGALAGPAHSSILLDSANSVFILDELHSYDPQRLGYILASMGLWVRLGGRIAVLSATLPTRLICLVRDVLGGEGGGAGCDGDGDGVGDRRATACASISATSAASATSTSATSTSAAASAASTTASTGVPVTVVEADHRAAPLRHRVRVGEHHLTDPRTVTAIAERLDGGQSVLVVANNVADTQAVYGELAPVARERFGDDAARLLHSRFRRCDRSRIEADIVTRYRAGAAPAERRPGLVVATQVVEVSLDVDFDVLFTSAAPLDALAQRFGRVNRVGERPPADVVVCPADMRRRRGEGTDEFADGVYRREPTDLAWNQLTRHDGEVVSEAALVDWLDEVYASDWGGRWQADVEDRRETFDIRILDFSNPFEDRSQAAEQFDKLFEGTEAVLSDDVDAFTEALRSVPSNRRAGRLLAEDYLLPLPVYARSFPRWDKKLGVAVVDGEYDSERGLLSLRGPQRDMYAAGEVI
jgi:CRISPR-associated endonuclease/helicase Cas3